jgi:hypothetical protein
MTGRACPSSSLEHATHLVGIVRDDGRIAYISPALPLTPEFKASAAAAGEPERRLRVAGACVEEACIQWDGVGCGLADRLVAQVGGRAGVDRVPACGIRRDCRWFAQRGVAACKVCPVVVTNSLDQPASAPAPAGTAFG